MLSVVCKPGVSVERGNVVVCFPSSQPKSVVTFAQVRLHESSAAWHKAVEAGQRLVRNEYDAAANLGQVKVALEGTIDNLSGNRFMPKRGKIIDDST